MIKKLFVIASILCSGSYVFGQTVEIKITNLRNSEGSIRIAVYNSESNYENDKAIDLITLDKSDLKGSSMTYSLELPREGTYGIALLDDENDDTEMNYTLLGIPTEGYAFFNFYHTGMSKPKFNDFEFTVNREESFSGEAKIRYLK